MNQSADHIAALQRAQRAYHDGRMGLVESECRQVLESAPDSAEAWVLLAAVARHHGNLSDAAEIMRRAVQLKPDNRHMREMLGGIYLKLRDWRNAQPIFERLHAIDPDPAHENALAKCDWGMGRYERALERFRHAAGDAPGNAGLQVGLAQALISLSRRREARRVLENAAKAGGSNAMVWLLLARLAYDDDHPGAALPLVKRAAACPDANAAVHLHHAAFLKLAGRTEAAADARRRVPDNPSFEAQWESLEYALSHRPPARLYGFAEQVLEQALEAATVKGLTLEFGVYHGRSLRLIADRVGSDVHGFDSFRGLPEDWSPAEAAGSYSTGGRKPEMPEHVTLHEGWFEETLPEFMASQRRPVRLAHIDCDLYSSTLTVLDHIGPGLREGSVLVFDDYLGYPGWREHEYRAFQEFSRENSLQWRYLAFDLLDRQVAVQVTRAGE